MHSICTAYIPIPTYTYTVRVFDSFFLVEIMKNHGIVCSNGTRWSEHRRFALSVLKDFGMGRSSMEEKIGLESEHLCDHLASIAGDVLDAEYVITRR